MCVFNNSAYNTTVQGNSLVEEEASRAGSDVVVFVLQSDDVKVHQVSVHLAVAGRWVPAGSCQHLQHRKCDGEANNIKTYLTRYLNLHV